MVYLMVSMFLTALILGALERNTVGIFSVIDFNLTVGFGFLISAIWTFLTRNDSYLYKSGKKVKMDTRNEFFFITMKIWSYLFFIAGFAFLFYGCLQLT